MSNEKTTEATSKAGEDKSPAPAWIDLVRKQVSSLKFGTVQITIHDARVTQVERLDKVRLDRSPTVSKNTNQTTGA